MKILKICATVCLIAGFAASAVARETLSARDVQQKSIEATRVDGTESVSTLTIIDEKGRERVRRMATVTKLYDDGALEKKLIKFIEPSEVKGTGFLTFDHDDKDDDKWIYLPALRKTRRIVSSENAKSFMGSEFSYADMSMPTVDDFHYRFLPDETAGDALCWVVEIIPKDDEVANNNGFSKKISSIGKKDYVLRKAVYYDLSGEREKLMEVKSIIEVDAQKHRYKLEHTQITNERNGRKSTSVIEQITFSPDIPDDFFTTRYLEKK